MLIKKREIENLSSDIRRIIDGQPLDLRDNREGAFCALKNDIHTLTNIKNEQIDSFQRERDMMTETLANISHQLKTPLTSMMIMADLLENAPEEKQAEFISNIRTGITRMEWLVSALLKMAQLDAGAIKLARAAVKSHELVSLSLEPIEALLDSKNQNIEIIGDIELFCDRRWTAEALTNVLKNASEYSPENSVIHVEAGTNPICRWISVTDSGGGIAKDKIAGIFKRFAGSRSDKGFGIGLPLALAIMRGQNGDIEVNGGGRGNGATFTLKLFK